MSEMAVYQELEQKGSFSPFQLKSRENEIQEITPTFWMILSAHITS